MTTGRFSIVADAENRDLRLVDDRHPEERAEDAGVRDRECAAGRPRPA